MIARFRHSYLRRRTRSRLSEALLGAELSPAMNLEKRHAKLEEQCLLGRVSTMEAAKQGVDEEASAQRTQLRKELGRGHSRREKAMSSGRISLRSQDYSA